VYLLLLQFAVCMYMYMYYSTVTFEPLESCSATHAGMTDHACVSSGCTDFNW